MYTLSRVHPFAELDRLFDGVLRPAAPAAFDPALDVTEEEKEFLVRAELPGVAPEAVGTTFEDGVLTIRGEKTSEETSKDARSYRAERRWGAFARSVRFGTAVDADGVTAAFRHGVLTVRLPKEAKARARTIEVKPE